MELFRGLFGFGGRKRRGGRAKPSRALIRRAKKYGVRVTRKAGSKRVYRKVSNIKKDIKKKRRSMKMGKRSAFGKRRRQHRRRRFGKRSVALGRRRHYRRRRYGARKSAIGRRHRRR